jgi:hypothetical protein
LDWDTAGERFGLRSGWYYFASYAWDKYVACSVQLEWTVMHKKIEFVSIKTKERCDFFINNKPWNLLFGKQLLYPVR